MTQENASQNRLAIQGLGQLQWKTFICGLPIPALKAHVLWLHGCAGAGKSAIAQMFAKSLQTEGRLGASFFFQRGHPKRGTWNLLIPTIAYQLATSVTELLLPIQQAVEGDKLIVGRALAISFQALLVEPLKKLPDLQRTPVIVLDGLDECADHKIQQQILRLFIGAIRHHNLHLRLLIVSRPEPHLREVLEHEETFAICRHFALSADESAYRDIRTYFHTEFSHRLNSVLELDPQSTAPLDDLYTQILSVVPQEQEGLQLRILHTLCLSMEKGTGYLWIPKRLTSF
ncbi:hypothetical protein B0H14DRAFT_3771167 [Mycena olivaceomarginata]|nr:hypothetical protein B0H14DRAFT_3771167 [Mycena olivaceomarginata]